jgi:acyl carrier protein
MLCDASDGAVGSISDADHDAELQDLGFDSLSLKEFAATFQDRFSIMIPDESLGRVRTVNDLERAVNELLDRTSDPQAS